MSFWESSIRPPLAHRLGETPHLSPLLRKAERFSGAGEHLAEWLLKVAILRGAGHYERPMRPALPPDNPALNDEEVGVALCLAHLPDDPVFVRAASQLLSSPAVNPEELVRLARMERVETVLCHIAAACARVDQNLEPWATVRRELKPRRQLPEGTLSHWTRFAALIGLTRHGMMPPQWIKRDEQPGDHPVHA